VVTVAVGWLASLLLTALSPAPRSGGGVPAAGQTNRPDPSSG